VIKIECIAVVVPKIHVKRAFPGGWAAATQTENGFENCPVMFDEDLFAEGAMSPLQVHRFILRWKALGLLPHKNRRWHEICVVDMFAGPTFSSRISWGKHHRDKDFGPVAMEIGPLMSGNSPQHEEWMIASIEVR